MTPAGKHKLVPKLWGSECWIVNNEKYCGKILHLKPGFESSLHYHNVKHETMLCIDGCIQIELKDRTESEEPVSTHLSRFIITPSDSLELPPGSVHRFQALGKEATLIEFSTHHDDADVMRLEPSRKVDTETP